MDTTALACAEQSGFNVMGMVGMVSGGDGSRITWRLWAVVLVMGMLTAGLTARLAHLQIWLHPEYVEEARGEHIDVQTLPAHRGDLLDRKGHPLATSRDTWKIGVDRKVWSDEQVGQAAAEKLALLIGRTPAEVYSMASDEKVGAITLAHQVDYNIGRAIVAEAIPGVIIEQSSKRSYPEGDLAATLIGFTGRDQDGLTGFERDFERTLKGESGKVWFERDSLGRPIPFGYRRRQEPVPGRDVILTVDRTVQRMAERELDEAIRQTKAKGGSLIVQEPKTGAILAMVSRPSFSRNSLDLSDAGQLDLVRNRAVTDQYEPGSVFKLLTMAAALESGKVNPNTTYLDTGLMDVGEREFKNWDLSANGPTTMTKVLVRSLNTGTVWLAHKILGPTLFYQFVRSFGFGSPTGIDLEGEASGMFRDPEAENWYRADLASNSFGQGISVTPLQIVNMVSTIANGGSLMRPYVMQESRGGDSVERTAPHVTRRVLSEETARTLREMMREVVDANSFARVPGYSAGGKSGTAYVPTISIGTRGDAYGEEVTIPSYVGFAPLHDPRISILVKLDNLGTSDFGGVLTAPVFARLSHDILTYLRVPPDRPDTLPKAQQPGQ